jgi:hypothetical protein
MQQRSASMGSGSSSSCGAHPLAARLAGAGVGLQVHAAHGAGRHCRAGAVGGAGLGGADPVGRHRLAVAERHAGVVKGESLHAAYGLPVFGAFASDVCGQAGDDLRQRGIGTGSVSCLCPCNSHVCRTAPCSPAWAELAAPLHAGAGRSAPLCAPRRHKARGTGRPAWRRRPRTCRSSSQHAHDLPGQTRAERYGMLAAAPQGTKRGVPGAAHVQHSTAQQRGAPAAHSVS